MITFRRRGASPGKGRIGEFFCPNCGARRSYRRKKVQRLFNPKPPPTSVFTERYSVSLIPMDVLQEFVECRVCRRKFKPAALLRDPAARRETRPGGS